MTGYSDFMRSLDAAVKGIVVFMGMVMAVSVVTVMVAVMVVAKAMVGCHGHCHLCLM